MLPSLNITEQVTHFIDYADLDAFVNAVYKFEKDGDQPWSEYPYSFIAAEECGNDVSIEFYVTGEFGDFDVVEHDRWVQSGGKGWVSNYNVMNDLCRMGYLESGDYIVRVSW